MKTELDAKHAAIASAVTKYAGKVSPLLVACGLIQEGMNLSQTVMSHAQELKDELDKLKASKSAEQNGGAIREDARGPQPQENRG